MVCGHVLRSSVPGFLFLYSLCTYVCKPGTMSQHVCSCVCDELPLPFCSVLTGALHTVIA